AEAYGATVRQAPELLHGKTSQVVHDGHGVLAGLPNPFTATRYHSLAVDPATIPDVLEVTGATESGVIMAVKHREDMVEGVQFHPESVLTEGGHEMLADPVEVQVAPSAAEPLSVRVARLVAEPLWVEADQSVAEPPSEPEPRLGRPVRSVPG
ncbi:MAG: hypothetical protein EBY60_10020, partial [Actinobacteria bacterium]|nr:hypothetical protein [Actinomycetota bacterium]